MKTISLIVALAALGSAVPFVPRAVHTVVETVDVYETIVVYENAAPVVPSSAAIIQEVTEVYTVTANGGWKSHSHHKHPVSKSCIKTSLAAVPVSTPEAVASSVVTPKTTIVYVPALSSTPEVIASSVVTPKTSIVYVPAPASTPASSKAAASPSPSPSAAQPANSYAQKVVDHHNLHRANHSAPALEWDAELAAIAQSIGEVCVYAHNTTAGGGGYGQNIAAGCPASNITSVISDLFYNSELPNFSSLFGQKTPSNIDDHDAFNGYGHFTQVVWKGTTKVGCASVDCSKTGLGGVSSNTPPIFTVCNYKNAGNFLGEFDKNVLPALGHPTVTWEG